MAKSAAGKLQKQNAPKIDCFSRSINFEEKIT